MPGVNTVWKQIYENKSKSLIFDLIIYSKILQIDNVNIR